MKGEHGRVSASMATSLDEAESLVVGITRALADMRSARPRSCQESEVGFRFDSLIGVLIMARNDAVAMERKWKELRAAPDQLPAWSPALSSDVPPVQFAGQTTGSERKPIDIVRDGKCHSVVYRWDILGIELDGIKHQRVLTIDDRQFTDLLDIQEVILVMPENIQALLGPSEQGSVLFAVLPIGDDRAGSSDIEEALDCR